jgi:hypothetical protein
MTTKEQLQERAQLVRVHEANCQIQYPTPMEANFRLAIMKKLASEYGLKELRPAAIEPPTPVVAKPVAAAPRTTAISAPKPGPVPVTPLRLAKKG